MTKVGVIGIGDMGSGLAKNLIANGYETWGIDLLESRQRAFANMGGQVATSVAEVGQNVQAVFVMVMTGAEAHEVILGPGGLSDTMSPGGVILLTATIKPAEARAIGAALDGTGLHLIDSPVSGGYPGAQSGTLTMMAAGTDAALAQARPVMEAVSASIHRVGRNPGDGQTVKACLQSLIGAQFS
ncbi:MAG: NAD(P)-dependent oxidoreductase, partial [Pseudomonadota bacterium]